jgi:hypothetical protein
MPLDVSWRASKLNNGGGLTANAIGCVVDGVRIHNTHDAFIPLEGGDFVFTHCWVTHTRDDAIENDAFAGGLIEDCYFEGFYYFYSCTNSGGFRNGWTPNAEAPAPHGGPSSTVRIENCLIAFKRMNGLNGTPWGGLWKDWDRSDKGPRCPKMEFVNNIVYIPEGEEARRSLVPTQGGKVEGNILIDMGGKAGNSQGYTVKRGPQGQAFWDNAVKDWIERHPYVGRVEGDPGGYIPPEE